MAVIIRSDQALSAPIAGTPELLPRFDVSVTSNLVGRWSARSLHAAATANDAAVSSLPVYQGSATTATLTQTTPSRRPIYKRSGINGRAAMQFTNASGQLLVGPNFASAIETPLTIATVINPTNSGTNPHIIGGGNSTNFIHMWRRTDAGAVGQLVVNMGNFNFAINSPAGTSPTSPQVVVFRVGGANSKIWISNKTAAATATTTTTAATAAANLANISLGSTRGTTSATFDGLMAEALLYNAALTDQQVGTLLDELGEHYGITITGGS